MPCVLPVLPLILLRLVDQSKRAGGRRIASGLAFSAGVIGVLRRVRPRVRDHQPDHGSGARPEQPLSISRRRRRSVPGDCLFRIGDAGRRHPVAAVRHHEPTRRHFGPRRLGGHGLFRGGPQHALQRGPARLRPRVGADPAPARQQHGHRAHGRRHGPALHRARSGPVPDRPHPQAGALDGGLQEIHGLSAVLHRGQADLGRPAQRPTPERPDLRDRLQLLHVDVGQVGGLLHAGVPKMADSNDGGRHRRGRRAVAAAGAGTVGPSRHRLAAV